MPRIEFSNTDLLQQLDLETVAGIRSMFDDKTNTTDCFGDSEGRGVCLAASSLLRHLTIGKVVRQCQPSGNAAFRLVPHGLKSRSSYRLMSKKCLERSDWARIKARARDTREQSESSRKSVRKESVSRSLVSSPSCINLLKNASVPKLQIGIIFLDFLHLCEEIPTSPKVGQVGLLFLRDRQSRNIVDFLSIFLCMTKQMSNCSFKILVKYCKEKNISMTAYSPLGSRGLVKLLNKTEEIPDMLQNDVRIQENIQLFNWELKSEDMKKLTNLDLGEAGRICDFSFFKGIQQHVEFPF
ncbi:hypothetical protein WH47_11895 [Habropoda laboriosa]|uniref:NADP-dependent oxidoreductase domain-containing protein n=1 Tax=Habropoda laboriosa TaxID=597456 RepID=A0A0L7QLE4_9HYME|nr:hypothetical protein WH47_11895 [Habropoda laboriosa]